MGKKTPNRSYEKYIKRVLRKVSPKHTIRKDAAKVMNDLINDLFDRIMLEAAQILRISKGKVLTSLEIQAALKLLLPGELLYCAISRGVISLKNCIKSM